MEIKKQAWKNFMSSIDWTSDDTNFIYEFPIMTKKYGVAFIEYCKAAWIANDGIKTPEEFCKMNANIPISTFNKIIRRDAEMAKPDSFKHY